MAGFRTFRTVRKYLAPRWLTEGDGELLGYALDIVKDAFVERLRLGLLARFPQQDPDGTPAPDEALAAMGRDRREVRGIFETNAQYAARLKLWLEHRRHAGNPFMLMQKLAEYLGPLPSFRTVDVRGNWYSRAADGTETSSLKQGNWNWDGDTDRWSRFWVIIYPNGLWEIEPLVWGNPSDSAWGENPSTETLGTTAMPHHVQMLRALVDDWKPAGTRCENIILAFDPLSFDPTSPEPDGEWRNWGKDAAGTRVPSRLNTARYIGGRVV